MRIVSLALLLLVSSCKKDNPAPAPASPPQGSASTGSGSAVATGSASAAPQGDCASRAARIEKELRELIASRPGFMPLIRDLNAPTAAGEPVKERGLVIAITKDGGIFLQGTRLNKTDDVFDYVDAEYKRGLESLLLSGGSSRDFKLFVYLWADRDAPASVVAAVATAADIEHTPRPKRTGKLSPDLTLDDAPSSNDDPPPPEPEDPPPPPESAASVREKARKQAAAAGVLGKSDDKRESRVFIRLLVAAAGAAAPTPDASGPGAKLPASEPDATNYLVTQLRSAIGACAPIIKTLGTASIAGGPGPQAEALAKGIPAGLIECKCSIPDADALEWGARVWFGASSPQLASLAMPKIDKKEKRHLGELLSASK